MRAAAGRRRRVLRKRRQTGAGFADAAAAAAAPLTRRPRSFGKVIQVRKKDNGRIYAMKVLSKTGVISRKQYQHTLTERKILEELDHPFLVSLRFAFQTDSKLYMVFGAPARPGTAFAAPGQLSA